jgi:hypothetical protein
MKVCGTRSVRDNEDIVIPNEPWFTRLAPAFTVLSSVLRHDESVPASPGQRRPPEAGAARRRPSARVRRRRAVAATVAVVVVAVAGWFAILPTGGAPAHGTARPPVRAAAAPPVLDAAESGLLPWHLAAPLSREVVVPGSPGQVIVLGGLTSAGTSASGVYAVRTATGPARQIGALSAPLHDAAGVSSGGRSLVFGGGSPVTVGTVQAFFGAGTARVTGSLPAPRSDAAAVTISGTDYIVGGSRSAACAARARRRR